MPDGLDRSEPGKSDIIATPINIPFHSRRLEFPDGKGWIEIRGEFSPFDMNPLQLRAIGMFADWFRQFEETFLQSESSALSDSVSRKAAGVDQQKGKG